MPNYPEFCSAFFTYELPRILSVDRTLRALPSGMRDAIARHLGVPQGPSKVASVMFAQQINYVDLFRRIYMMGGISKHEPYDADDGLYYDNGAYSFCIGIWLEKTPNSVEGVTVYIVYHTEDYPERSATLSIDNLKGTIHIENTDDPKCFDAAAKQSLDRLIAFMSETVETPKNRPFGFHVLGSTTREL